MPVIARDTLHGTARTYGLLLASVGLGAVTGAFALAMVGRRVRRGKVLAAAAFSFSALLIAFSFSRNIWLSVAILFATGLTMILNNALANGLLQTITPDGLRGRVMSAYAFVFVGMAPVGSVLSGSVASALGASKVVFLTDVEGWRAEAADPTTKISEATAAEVRERLPQVAGGMRPKLEACLAALEGGVPAAHIVDGRQPHSLLLELFTNEGSGTKLWP